LRLHGEAADHVGHSGERAVLGPSPDRGPLASPAINPRLVTVLAGRGQFETLVLAAPEFDPVGSLAGRGHRKDLMTISPYEFEQLIQQLAEAMGMKSWRTQSSNDDGVDAVVYREGPFFAGVCLIQAKRYSKTVPVEDVRALYGTMHQKKAAVGIVVITSKFGRASYDFARETGRIELIDGANLKALPSNTWATTSSSAQAGQRPSLQVNAALIIILVPR
jgi:hypothetical protein